MGLIFLIFNFAYLGLTLMAIVAAWFTAKNIGGTPWLWACLTAVLSPCTLYWDLPLTISLHNEHCADYAGLFVFETPEEFAKRNPSYKGDALGSPLRRGVYLPDRLFRKPLSNRIASEMQDLTFFNMERRTLRIVDLVDDRVLVEYVNYTRTYNRGVFVFWLKLFYNKAECDQNNEAQNLRAYQSLFSRYVRLGLD